MNTVAARLLVSSRPVSWVNTAFPFAAAYLLTTREIDLVFVLGTLFFLIPYNVAMYGINDVFDYESDARNPRKGGIEGALLPPHTHRAVLWSAALLCAPFLVALYALGNLASGLWLTASAFAVVAYSAKGLRFKERPVIDSMTSSFHFVSPALVGFALAEASPSADHIVLLVAFFLWGAAAHAFGAIQDIVPDREAGIRSIATVFGARASARLTVVLWCLASLIMLVTTWPGPLAAAFPLLYLANALPSWNVTDATSGQVNTAWKRFLWLNYFSGFLVTLLLIYVWMNSLR